MITYTTKMVEQKEGDKVICDICKKEFDCKTDWLETQEFQYIRIHGGYGSVFGDDCKLKADICQHCFDKLVGKYLIPDEE